MRCPDCDHDGDVKYRGRWVKCPRCGGTTEIGYEYEEQPMNEEGLYRWLMISAAVLAVLCGFGAVALVVLCALTWSWGVLLSQAEFRTYVENEWGWQQSFTANTASYAGMAG